MIIVKTQKLDRLPQFEPLVKVTGRSGYTMEVAAWSENCHFIKNGKTESGLKAPKFTFL